MKLFKKNNRNKISIPQAPQRVAKIDWGLDPDGFSTDSVDEENSSLEELTDIEAQHLENKNEKLKPDELLSNSVAEEAPPLKVTNKRVHPIERMTKQLQQIDDFLSATVENKNSNLEITDTEVQPIKCKKEKLQNNDLLLKSEDNETPPLEVSDIRVQLLERKNEKLQDEIKFIYNLWAMTTSKINNVKKTLDAKKEECTTYDIKTKVNVELGNVNFKDT